MSINANPVVMAAALGGANIGPVCNLGGSGDHMILVGGTLGGAAVKIQASPDGGTTKIDVTGASIAALGSFILRASAGFTYYVVTTGGAGSSINVWAAQVA